MMPNSVASVRRPEGREVGVQLHLVAVVLAHDLQHLTVPLAQGAVTHGAVDLEKPLTRLQALPGPVRSDARILKREQLLPGECQ